MFVFLMRITTNKIITTVIAEVELDRTKHIGCRQISRTRSYSSGFVDVVHPQVTKYSSFYEIRTNKTVCYSNKIY